MKLLMSLRDMGLKNTIKMGDKNLLNPAVNIDFYDLYTNQGLRKIDSCFHDFFVKKNSELYQKFSALRNNSIAFTKIQKDDILINAAKVLEDFIVYLFNIEKENSALKKQHDDLQKIYYVKREFVQRIIAKKFKELPFEIDGIRVLRELIKISETNSVVEIEIILAGKIYTLLAKELSEKEKIDYENFALYAVWALYSIEGRRFHEDGALFNLPQKIDYDDLVKNKNLQFGDEVDEDCDAHKFANRDGFNLTDEGFNLNQALGEAHYCIFCHKQDKDSCRTGLTEKRFAKIDLSKDSSVAFQKNPLGINLEGCPLDQKISEMNLLKSEGFPIAAMAVAAIDNPLLAGTGHRICNDCMKSCIFQKQSPVNIPQIETKTLKDVLSLPYGFEVYGLLTRWNPLKFGDEIAKENSGKKVLIAGLGPAGYTLAHYLLNEGCDVVAIDGLKIEPINPLFSGIDEYGVRHNFKPIKYLSEICEPLSSRLIQGFGGVAEYGITSRWDKNFLTIIRLLLERRQNFRMFGGIRFGSSINDISAFNEYGFDHIALCIGAGRPNIINIKNNFAKGIRSSSDFLMSLQLNGAFKEELFTNLQLRLPIIVIGAGLTAVDTACEAQEYYITQIKKFSHKFEVLKNDLGEEKIWQNFSEEEKIIAREFLAHAHELRLNGKFEFIKKYHSKILYRKKLQDSPAYKLNHEELIKAFEQGIEFIENREPDKAILDEFSHIKALKCKNGTRFKCRSLLVAAGTSPNISIVLEDNLNIDLEGKYFAQIDRNGNKIMPTNQVKSGHYSFFTRIDNNKKAISFFGDLHPNFEGNVVKAMASAKIGYKRISELLNEDAAHQEKTSYDFFKRINQDFSVKVEKVEKISEHLNEITICAPLLANQAQLGQIFRLQNYCNLAPRKNGQILAMEGVAVTALNINKDKGLITGIVLDHGGSTSLIKNLQSNEPVIFMGPSGKPTEIPRKNETILLIGGGRGNMPLATIAAEFKKHDCKIIFCAGYKKNEFVVRQNEMEKGSDILIYAIEEENPALKLNRVQDRQIQGLVTDVLKKYFAQNPQKIDRIFTIGNDKMMAEIARIRHENLVSEITQAPIAIASLNASMQCMMKGVCSQCLQKKRDNNGNWQYFYACASQDQNMDKLDFSHLQARCGQNSAQEKITRLWIKYISK